MENQIQNQEQMLKWQKELLQNNEKSLKQLLDQIKATDDLLQEKMESEIKLAIVGGSLPTTQYLNTKIIKEQDNYIKEKIQKIQEIYEKVQNEGDIEQKVQLMKGLIGEQESQSQELQDDMKIKKDKYQFFLNAKNQEGQGLTEDTSYDKDLIEDTLEEMKNQKDTTHQNHEKIQILNWITQLTIEGKTILEQQKEGERKQLNELIVIINQCEKGQNKSDIKKTLEGKPFIKKFTSTKDIETILKKLGLDKAEFKTEEIQQLIKSQQEKIKKLEPLKKIKKIGDKDMENIGFVLQDIESALQKYSQQQLNKVIIDKENILKLTSKDVAYLINLEQEKVGLDALSKWLSSSPERYNIPSNKDFGTIEDFINDTKYKPITNTKQAINNWIIDFATVEVDESSKRKFNNGFIATIRDPNNKSIRGAFVRALESVDTGFHKKILSCVQGLEDLKDIEALEGVFKYFVETFNKRCLEDISKSLKDTFGHPVGMRIDNKTKKEVLRIFINAEEETPFDLSLLEEGPKISIPSLLDEIEKAKLSKSDKEPPLQKKVKTEDKKPNQELNPATKPYQIANQQQEQQNRNS